MTDIGTQAVAGNPDMILDDNWMSFSGSVELELATAAHLQTRDHC